MQKIPKLPKLLDRKIYKSGQTRGADDDVIYQNRVNRNNTVLIPFHVWQSDERLYKIAEQFENGYIVLINPSDYYDLKEPEKILAEYHLILGKNCLLFYETRDEWNMYNPSEKGIKAALNRRSPLGGEYVARIPATTAENDNKINIGFTKTSQKGAGIRLYEYASAYTIQKCRLQLEAIFWCCYDALKVVQEFGMSEEDAIFRKDDCLNKCKVQGLLDINKMKGHRILDDNYETICPLCQKKLSGYGFFKRLPQAEGREVPDLTVTEINLFHIDELKYGVYNHKPYNLGWGHHHCNVVVKDSGIEATLQWMKEVLIRNGIIDNN
ncbi:MAG: BstXI family restriction endonuclease [Lachnoclostridium sp.]|nr:BstXI family restriction endonuclease [Lachnospira sp.]MCM1248265.1 BstXI family restriction endonuclease [Lachnoclostridium sp.]